MEQHEWRNLIEKFEIHLKAERGLADLTIRNYKADLAPLYDFIQREQLVDMKAFDRALVRAYLAWLTELGYVRSSVVRKLSTLRTFVRWLIRQQIIEKDPPISGTFNNPLLSSVLN